MNPTKPDIQPDVLSESTGTRHAVNAGPIILEISEYFLHPTVSSAAFYKALRTRKIERFTEVDEGRALESLSGCDPSGERLWNLLSQPKLPNAVDRWIWRAVQDRLRILLGPEFDLTTQDPSLLLRGITSSLADHLISKVPTEHKAAENWLRIGICWLLEKRSLDPWIAADMLSSVLFKQKGDAVRVATEAVRRGRFTEFRQAVAMTAFASSRVEAAQRDSDSERRNAARIEQKLAAKARELDELHTELIATNAKLSFETEVRVTAEARLQHERQHWGHDITETKAEHRTLLRERILPMISDAVDALEIEPPAPHIALRRLQTILSVINEAKDE